MTIENPSSQNRRPWQTVARSTMTAILALLPILPTIAYSLDIETIPVVAAVLAVSAAITRVLALPEVEAWLRDYAPWLAADEYEGRHRKESH